MKPEGDLELGAAGVAAVAARRRAHKKAGMRHHDGQKRSWWSRAWRGKEEYRKTDNVSGSRGSSLKDESTDVDGPPPTLSPRYAPRDPIVSAHRSFPNPIAFAACLGYWRGFGRGVGGFGVGWIEGKYT